MDFDIIKYPRTHHLEGSRLQPGDEDLSQIPFREIKGKNIVIEEKIDGANCALSFDNEGNLLLQSRGHYLTGGYRERHFNLFKKWANEHIDEFFDALGCRYIMYGEWLYAKHTVFYDLLPHYFLEFDIYDREKKEFLDTNRRREITNNLPVSSVPVLAIGKFNRLEDILAYLGKSNYISDDHMSILRDHTLLLGLNPELAIEQTDNSNLMEGLYIKVEENGIVADRMKYVRYTFLQAVFESNSHWLDRPIIPNLLKKDDDC